MTVNKYFEELNSCLGCLSKEERAEAINFYQEYAEDAAIDNYADLVARFGTPKVLASKIYSEVANKIVQSPKNKMNDHLNAAVLAIVAVLSLPLSLPLVIVAFAIILSFGLALLSIIISFGFTSFALILAGLYLITFGSFSFISPFSLGNILKCLGGGLVIIALAIIFALITINLVKLILKFITLISSRIIARRTTNE